MTGRCKAFPAVRRDQLSATPVFLKYLRLIFKSHLETFPFYRSKQNHSCLLVVFYDAPCLCQLQTQKFLLSVTTLRVNPNQATP